MGYINAMEYYSAIKDKLRLFAATRMEPEGTILSEISQKEKNYQWLFL